jgi:hypothetical protein
VSPGTDGSNPSPSAAESVSAGQGPLCRFVLVPRRTMSGKEFIAEFLHPQISRPLGQVFALAGDTWPERVIAADLLHEELGAGGVHFVAEASHPIRMHRARAARRAHVRAAVGLTVIWSVALLSRQLPPFWPVLLRVIILVGLPTADGMPALLLDRLQRRLVTSGQASRRIFSPSDDPEAVELTALEKPLDEAGQEAIRMEMARSAGDLTAVVMQAARWPSRSPRCSRSAAWPITAMKG